MNALILAGAERENKLGLQVKANADIHGRPMVEYVAAALKQSGSIHTVAVIGPYEELICTMDGKVDKVLNGTGSILENVAEGARYLGQRENVLVCTCDIPMLTPEAVNDFIRQSMETGADFCYPVVERKVNDDKFPGIVRTYTTLKDGTFTGGNIFFMRPETVELCSGRAKQLIEYRKNALKMAGILGWLTLLRLLTGRLTIDHAEKRFSKIFGIKARAIISAYPELANDVDKPSDLEFARNYLFNRQKISED